jgi:tetratricopeptide (TPR) repeat protein
MPLRCASRVTGLVALSLFACAGSGHAQNYKEKPTYGVVNLRAGMNMNATVVKVEAGGNIQTKLGGVSAFVANPPDVRLNYTAGNGALIIRAESAADTTLLINLPDGSWVANDDGPNTGLNPFLRFNNPSSGQYDIWVGTFAGGKFPPAVLVISEEMREMARKDMAGKDMAGKKMPGKDMGGKDAANKDMMGKDMVGGASQYAVVEIENRTSKHPVRYRFRWGEAAWSNSVLLSPGRHQTHSLPMNSGGNAPIPQVTFEKGIGIDAGATTYSLEAYVNRSPSGGKGYNFTTREGKDTREYIDLFKRSKGEEDAAYKLNTAIMRILANDFKTGRELATLAIKADPTCPRAWAIRGRARMFEGDYDGALRDWAHGLRLAPTDTELLVFRAEAFGRKMRFEKVIDETAKALELDPFLASALSERSAAHYAMRNYDLAMADAKKSVKIEPAGWLPLTTLGKSSIAKRQYQQAVDYLNQAIAIQKNDFEPFAARAQAFQGLGNAQRATLDMREATRLRMPPGFAVYYPDEVAFRELDNYPLGSLVTPERLKSFNLLSFEVDPPFTGKAPPTMAADVAELVTGEWSRHRAFKIEATAGVDRFLWAARLTEAERKAKGLELNWYYGPVTSPVARFRSGDDLGGLRVIGNLKMPDRKELTMIFALTFYPPSGEKVENGKVGMLFDGDNSRLQAKLHSVGTLDTDYLFQSFGANVQQGQMVMRPGFNLDETTGSLTHETLTPSSLSTRCMHCHNRGFEPTEKLLEQVKIQRSNVAEEIAKLEGLQKFLELAYVNGAGKTELRQLKEQLIKGGPNSLLPLDDLYRANRQYWLEVYPQYVDLRRNPQAYLTPGITFDPARMQRPPGMDMKEMKK